MRRLFSLVADVALYAIVYLILQIFLFLIIKNLIPYNEPIALGLSQAISTVLAVIIFIALKWASISKIKNTKNKALLLLSLTLLALTLLPSSIWIMEMADANLPEEYEQMFTHLLSNPLGMITVILFAPLAEEIVFRGAILRRLLAFFPYSDDAPYRPWIAIAVSALLFAVIHGNMAQGPHAFAIGALLGWIYYRTGSIIPGFAFHCVNNALPFVSLIFFDKDAQLIDICCGNYTFMYTLIVASAFLSIVLLALIVKKAL